MHKSDDSNKMRAKIWFSKISNGNKIKAAQLDEKFNQYTNDKDGKMLRLFGPPSRGMLPSTGNHNLRKFNLVKIVDKTPGFYGTKEIYDSIFWEFAKDRTRHKNMYQFRIFATQCIKAAIKSADMSTLKLETRYLLRELPLEFGHTKQQVKKVKFPDFLLTKVTLEQLAAIGVLYREAYLSCSFRYSEELKVLYLEKLNEFLKEPWVMKKFKKDFYKLATKILCPISQNNRNLMTSIFDNLEIESLDRSARKFLKDHHKAARYDESASPPVDSNSNFWIRNYDKNGNKPFRFARLKEDKQEDNSISKMKF